MAVTYTKKQVEQIAEKEKVDVLVYFCQELSKCKNMAEVKIEIQSVLVACQAAMKTDSIAEARKLAREIIKEL